LHPGSRTVVIVMSLAVHTLLIVVCAYSNFVTIDEGGHLYSGLRHWQTGAFELYRVNPPLPRLLATLPLWFLDPQMEPAESVDRPGERLEFEGSWAFAKHNQDRYLELVRISRLMGMVWSLVGALVVLRWADELFGRRAGLLALILWCFGPNVLAYGSLITPDLPSAVMALVSCYLFRGYLREPTWPRVWFAGVGLGLALLTKHTFILWLGVWPIMALVYLFGAVQARRLLLRLLQLGTILGLGILILNAGYGFHGSGKALGDYRFVSKLLTNSPGQPSLKPGNRFSASLWEGLPIPLPADYVLGMDLQRVDFEARWPFYWEGTWSEGGRWYFYLIAFLWKVPLGSWVLFAMSLGMFIWGGRQSWREEFLLCFPAIVLLAVISSQTGLNYFRYGLVVLPFALIFLSRVGSILEKRRPVVSVFIVAMILWSIVSGFRAFPNSLMYFNELAGGPENAHRHLVDSNLDWGQDILALKRWLDQSRPGKRIFLGYFGSVDPAIVGIDYELPPLPQPSSVEVPGSEERRKPELTSGIHAVSIHLIQGGTFMSPNGRGGRQLVPFQSYRFYEQFTPIAKTGTIWIYELSDNSP